MHGDGENDRFHDDLRTELVSSIVQQPRNVGEVNGSANCHGVCTLVDGDGVEMAQVDFNPILDRTQGG